LKIVHTVILSMEKPIRWGWTVHPWTKQTQWRVCDRRGLSAASRDEWRQRM